jgi:A/G-specific adenine glycosylase
MDEATIAHFQATVYDHYAQRGRHDLAWRLPEADGTYNAYKIMVSELMLQQTQVTRVIPKYQEFLAAFPTPQSLASAELGDVLRVWSGLGYNRRAKFLYLAARMIVHDLNGLVPNTARELSTLPGVGVNTAGAIMSYAYNQPVVFIETNIRTVYIHHFFQDVSSVSDTQIAHTVAQTLDSEQPRVWYWALMDYGSDLKRTIGNASTASTTYTKQATFKGSRREIRGLVIKQLSIRPMSQDELRSRCPDQRLATVLVDLVAEGLVRQTALLYSL